MKNLNMKSAIKRYNDIMFYIGQEYNTIGIEYLSDATDKKLDWTIRDMVAEIDYISDTYYEPNHWNCELRYEDYKMWKSEIGRLERFVKAYKPFIKDAKCVVRHCSKYDN